HGIEPFRRNLDEKLDLTEWAAGELAKLPGIEIVAAPQLTVVAFRIVKAGAAGPELNALNRRLLVRINVRQRVFLTGTMLGERFVIRICVLSFRTHRARVEAPLEDIHAALRDV